MTFKPFLTDKVTLVNKDGTTHENIPAGVQAKLILIADASPVREKTVACSTDAPRS